MKELELKGTSLIGADRGPGGAGEIRAINPATGELLEPAYKLEDLASVETAARLAREAFATYRDTPAAERAAFLRSIADRIESAAELIVGRMQAESGLPEGRCRGELGRTCGQLRMFAGLVKEGSWVDVRIEHADRERKPAPKPDLRAMRRPLGPVAVFCASNFPLAFSVAGGDTASALAAGCPVVVKAHSSHPGTAELVGNAVREAVAASGMPAGVFSLLYGRGSELGQALVGHPAIKAVGFTGSRAGGTALMKVAAARPEPIPVYAEMSSINPVFLLPGAVASRGGEIATGFVGSLTLGAGQFCTNPGLVFMIEGELEEFNSSLRKALAEVAPATMLHRGICSSFRETAAFVESQSGVEVLARAGREAAEGEAAGVVFSTSAANFLERPELTQEMFGPAALVVRCRDQKEMTRVARSLEGQLTATVHCDTTEELVSHADLIEVIEEKSGRLVFNGFPTGVEVCSAMVHGGPYPATSDGRSTSVGTMAVERFTRAVCWQDCPDALLPPELRESNPLGLRRMLDGHHGA